MKQGMQEALRVVKKVDFVTCPTCSRTTRWTGSLRPVSPNLTSAKSLLFTRKSTANSNVDLVCFRSALNLDLFWRPA